MEVRRTVAQATGGPPEDVTPREAANRWMSKRRLDLSEQTQSTYWYRLKSFVLYCEENGIDRMRDITTWDLDEYDTLRREAVETKVSLAKQYRTLNNWLQWAENVGLVSEGLADVLEAPEVKKHEEVNTVRLHPDVATANIRAFRLDSVEGGFRASKYHVLLELMWVTGARIGAIAGLDVRDVNLDTGRISFHHRPDSETPLKNDAEGERIIGIPDGVVDVLEDYVRENRHQNVFDDYRREPFLTAPNGRPGRTTLRRYSYYASLPCHGGPCPHDRAPESCDWAHTRNARGCPSSRSPHRVRTGALTNMLNKDIPLDRVSERVNTSPSVLKKHYDFAEKEEEFEERREPYVDHLAIDEEDDEDDEDDDVEDEQRDEQPDDSDDTEEDES